MDTCASARSSFEPHPVKEVTMIFKSRYSTLASILCLSGCMLDTGGLQTSGAGDSPSKGTTVATAAALHQIRCVADGSIVLVSIVNDVKTGRVRLLEGNPVFVGYGADAGTPYGWPAPAGDPMADPRTKLCDVDVSMDGGR